MSFVRPYSIRGIFLFNPSGKLEYSQRYAMIEARVPKHHPKIPPNEELTKYFTEKILPKLSSESQFEFKIDNHVHMVVMPTKACILSVIPLIESIAEPNNPHIEIAASYHFLDFIEPLLRPMLKNMATNPAPGQIYQIINMTAPFGTPIAHDGYFVSQLPLANKAHLLKAGYSLVAPAPVPSWKSLLVFHPQQLEFKMRETIIASIEKEKTYYAVYGELRSIAALSYLPDVTLHIENKQVMKDIATHFSIKSFDDALIVSPPTGISQLLLWKSDAGDEPPITGTYITKSEEDNGISFTLSVKTRPGLNVKGVNFTLPFPDRGQFVKHQFTPQPGSQIKMSKRESAIMWSVDLSGGEAVLSGVLHFERTATSRLRAFVDLKSKTSTFTGVAIRNEAVMTGQDAVTPTFEHSFATEAKKYVIWADNE